MRYHGKAPANPSPACGGGQGGGGSKFSAPTIQRDRARGLRRNLTDAERIIWNAVRAHRLAGVGFKRQKAIGPYIVDFVCLEAMLVVEIDGGQHYRDAEIAADDRRDEYLVSRCFRVVRFSNLDVLKDREGVLTAILEALSRTPSQPPPQAGEGFRPSREEA